MQFGLLAIIIIIMRIILLCVYYSAFPQASLFSATAQISAVGGGHWRVMLESNCCPDAGAVSRC